MSLYSEQMEFAAGTLIAARTDIANGTPQRFGILQDVAMDMTADIKELTGQYRYAVALAPGKTKIEVKAKFAGIRGALFNSLYYGATTAATQILFADSEQGSIPGMSPYTVTVSNSSKFIADQGVFYQSTGLPFALVLSAPTVGQYAVSAGVYTFAAADEGVAVLISYTYSSTSGIQILISNIRMGIGPSFRMVLDNAFDGRQATYIFNNCMASKLSLPTKQDDFQISELDFMVAADGSGNIGTINYSL